MYVLKFQIKISNLQVCGTNRNTKRSLSSTWQAETSSWGVPHSMGTASTKTPLDSVGNLAH